MAGLFVTFEGIDGCGKTTQAHMLVQHLQEMGRTVVHTRQPGGTPLGETLRELLLHRFEMDHSLETEILLMCADRADHVESMIRPALLRSEAVVCERYTDSTMAYQGYGHDGSAELLQSIRAINDFATKGLMPHLTFLLDIDPGVAFTRRGTTPDRIEARGKRYYQKVREGYLAIANHHPDRIVVIDGGRTVSEVHRAVVQALEKLGALR